MPAKNDDLHGNVPDKAEVALVLGRKLVARRRRLGNPDLLGVNVHEITVGVDAVILHEELVEVGLEHEMIELVACEDPLDELALQRRRIFAGEQMHATKL